MPTRTLTRSRRKWKTKRAGVLRCRDCAFAIWNYTRTLPATCLAVNKRRAACPRFAALGSVPPVVGVGFDLIEVLFQP